MLHEAEQKSRSQHVNLSEELHSMREFSGMPFLSTTYGRTPCFSLACYKEVTSTEMHRENGMKATMHRHSMQQSNAHRCANAIVLDGPALFRL